MRRLWRYQPAALAVWPYLILLTLSLPDADAGAFHRFLACYALLTVPVYLGSWLRAAQLRRAGDTAALVNTALWVKLAHLPFYLGVFLLGVVLILVMVVPIFTLASPLLVLMLALWDYLLLLSSSGYALSAVRLLRQEGRLSPGRALGCTLCLFCFVLDLFAALGLRRALRSPRQ